MNWTVNYDFLRGAVAFAIGQAIVTIRPIIGVFFASSRWSGLTPYDVFGTAFWIGFVLHLIGAEVWIPRR
jgi:hypothetical protein